MLARILLLPLMIERRDTAAIEARASPRKPRVVRFNKSSDWEILLVQWGRAQFLRSSRVIPSPLSEILTFSIPPPVISTEIVLAPLSTALSRSSRTIAAGRSITSPAAILRATSTESALRGRRSLDGLASSITGGVLRWGRLRFLLLNLRL